MRGKNPGEGLIILRQRKCVRKLTGRQHPTTHWYKISLVLSSTHSLNKLGVLRSIEDWQFVQRSCEQRLGGTALEAVGHWRLATGNKEQASDRPPTGNERQISAGTQTGHFSCMDIEFQ